MMYLSWALKLVCAALVFAFLHYTLPQTDIARITGTETIRQDFGINRIFWANGDAGSDGTAQNRDVFFIQTKLANGKTMVYRNEDTSWGWPPYFKFDTSDLQTEASDLTSTAANPNWVAIRHYGWRNRFITIFPNAVSMRSVESSDIRIIPWLNIGLLVAFFAIFWAIRVRWLRFRENRINPVVDEWTDGWG
ncbi:MAG: DUF1523 family protein [Pseudomonadota bacterium]